MKIQSRLVNGIHEAKMQPFKGEVHSENYFFFYRLKLFSSALRDEQKKPREKILIFGEVMNV